MKLWDEKTGDPIVWLEEENATYHHRCCEYPSNAEDAFNQLMAINKLLNGKYVCIGCGEFLKAAPVPPPPIPTEGYHFL